MIRVGEKCKSCKYWGTYTGTCSYILVENRPRTRDKDGHKIDAKYCDKYTEGKPIRDKSFYTIRRKRHEQESD